MIFAYSSPEKLLMLLLKKRVNFKAGDLPIDLIRFFEINNRFIDFCSACLCQPVFNNDSF